MQITTAFVQKIVQGARTLTLGIFASSLAVAIAPTTTKLAISPTNPVSAGTVVTLTAAVTSSGANVTRGLVLFCNAAAVHCEDSAILGQAQLTGAGLAILKLRLGLGGHSIRASFQGTTVLAPSQSASGTLTVSGSSSATVKSAGSGTAGAVTLTGSVSVFGAIAPTGTLSFLDAAHGNTELGSFAMNSAVTTRGFVTSLIPSTVSDAVSLAVGDFNGDGIPDLAISEFFPQVLLIYLGAADGTFTLKSSLAYSNAIFALAVADFNGDGIADLATIDLDVDATLKILLGNGDGTFATKFSARGTYAPVFATGDFNRDGIPDIAVSNGVGSIDVLLGNGDGTFAFKSSSAAAQDATAILVSDVNGDGIPDLVSPDVDRNTITVLIGNGDGTFQSKNPFSIAGLWSAAVADFNGDGIPDLVATIYGNQVASSIVVLLGRGDGTFIEMPTAISINFLTYISVGDFNGDGMPDIVALAQPNNDLYVFLGNGNGAFTQLTEPSSGVSSYAVADLNGDGFSDIVAGQSPLNIILLSALTATDSIDVPVGAGVHQIVASYSGDSNYSAATSTPFFLDLDPPADPLFHPSSGLYQWTQQVTLTDATPGAVIHYTLDGTPATPSSATYASPITVTWDGNISAIAVAASGAYSSVVTGTYTIDRPLPPPAFSLLSGTYTAPQSVTLTDDPTYCGHNDAVCEIYYTLNGTTPTTWASTKYTGPITLGTSGLITIKAIATSHHFVASTVASATYTLQ